MTNRPRIRPSRLQWYGHDVCLFVFARGKFKSGHTNDGVLMFKNRRLYIKLLKLEGRALSKHMTGINPSTTGDYICMAVKLPKHKDNAIDKHKVAFVRAYSLYGRIITATKVTEALRLCGYTVHYTPDPGGTAQDNIDLSYAALSYATKTAKKARSMDIKKGRLDFALNLKAGINAFLIARKSKKRVDFSAQDAANLVSASFSISSHERNMI